MSGEASLFSYTVLPLLIFGARVIDVSLGTLRVSFIARGNRFLAPIIGFVEVLVWLLAITQILQNLTNVLCYVGYAGGFATGTFLGLWIEGRLALGNVMIRVITRHDATPLVEDLKKRRYGLTYLDAQGATGTVQVIFSLVKRSEAPKVIALIKQHNPNAFYSVEDTRFVSDPVLPGLTRSGLRELWMRLLKRK